MSAADSVIAVVLATTCTLAAVGIAVLLGYALTWLMALL